MPLAVRWKTLTDRPSTLAEAGIVVTLSHPRVLPGGFTVPDDGDRLARFRWSETSGD